MKAHVIHAHVFEPISTRAPVPVRRRRRVRALAPRTRAPVVATLNGRPILRAEWGRRVADGDVLTFTRLPRGGEGGSNPLATLASIALLVAAPYAAGAILGTTAALAGATLGGQLLTTGIMLAGSALINSLVPAPTVASSEIPTPSPTYSLQAQGNSARLGQPVPVGYGRLKVFPEFATAPWASFEGNDQFVYQLLCVGRGDYDVDEILIEDTPVAAFPEIETEIVPPNGTLTLFPGNVSTADEVSGQEFAPLLGGTWARSGTTVTVTTPAAHNLAPGMALSVAFTSGSGPANGIYVVATAPTATTFTLTTASGSSSGNFTYSLIVGGFDGFVVNAAGTETQKLAYDLVCPRGLYSLDGDGELAPITLHVTLQAREIDDAGDPVVGSSWLTLDSVAITGQTATPVRKTYTYALPASGRYKVRAWRSDAKSSNPAEAHDVLWAGVRAFLADDRQWGDVTLVAVKLRATNSLNQLTQRKIGLVVQRKLPVWDGSTWGPPQRTRSIAWAIADMARATYGGRLVNTRVDAAALLALDAVWGPRGDRFDYRFEQRSTVWAAISMAALAGRSRAFMQGGKLRIVRDAPTTVPVAHFGMRNIAKGSFAVDYLMETEETADLIKVSYFDATQWRMQTVKAKLEGSVAAKPAQLAFEGITDRNHAHREGLFHAACNRYRRRLVTFDTSTEGLIVSPLDLVSIQHDTPAWGAHAEATGWDAGTRLLTLTEPMPFLGDDVYYMGLRRDDGSLSGPWLVFATPDPLVVELEEVPDHPINVAGNARERTHTTFGRANSWRTLAKVLSVKPAGLDRVRLVVVPEDPSVHIADEDNAPGPIRTSLLVATPKAPIVRGLRARQIVGNRVAFSWKPAEGAYSYEIEMGSGIDPFDPTLDWTGAGIAHASSFTADLMYGARTVIRLRAVGLLPGPWTYGVVGDLVGHFWTSDASLFWGADASLFWS